MKLEQFFLTIEPQSQKKRYCSAQGDVIKVYILFSCHEGDLCEPCSFAGGNSSFMELHTSCVFCGWRCVCGGGGIHAVFFIFDMFFTRLPLPMNSAVTPFPVPATVNKSAFTRHTVSSILRFWGLHGSMFVLLKSLSLWANACTNRQNRSTINKTSGSRGQSTQSATTLHSWTI